MQDLEQAEKGEDLAKQQIQKMLTAVLQKLSMDHTQRERDRREAMEKLRVDCRNRTTKYIQTNKGR
jgi:hypothetical protein